MAKENLLNPAGLTPAILERLKKLDTSPELIGGTTLKLLVSIDKAISARIAYIASAAEILKSNRLTINNLADDIHVASTKTIYNHPIVVEYVKLRAEEAQQILKGLLPVPISGRKLQAAIKKAADAEEQCKKLNIILLDQELIQMKMDNIQEENTTLKNRINTMIIRYAEMQKQLDQYKKSAMQDARRANMKIIKRDNNTNQ